MRYVITVLAGCLLLACGPAGKKAGENVPATFPIKLGTFTDTRQHGVTDLFVFSPWEPNQYSQLTFPEHCWGENLPNTSHDSDTAVVSRWVINPDSASAVFENHPSEGVTYRSLAQVDSMAVRMTIQIENHTDLPLNNVRALVCYKPDATVGTPGRADGMLAFRASLRWRMFSEITLKRALGLPGRPHATAICRSSGLMFTLQSI